MRWTGLLLVLAGAAGLAQEPPEAAAGPPNGTLLIADFEDEGQIEAFVTSDSNREADPELSLIHILIEQFVKQIGATVLPFNSIDNILVVFGTLVVRMVMPAPIPTMKEIGIRLSQAN